MVARRPKHKKYVQMIQNLAQAVEKHPFNMKVAAKYLNEWVTEKMQMSPKLDISVLVSRKAKPAPRAQAPRSGAVTGLEPAVSSVVVRSTGGPNAEPQSLNPKVTVIFGLADSLRACQGLGWDDALQQAYAMWGRVGANLASVLDQPQSGVEETGDANIADPVNEGDEKPPEEDDHAFPLDPNDDRGDF